MTISCSRRMGPVQLHIGKAVKNFLTLAWQASPAPAHASVLLAASSVKRRVHSTLPRDSPWRKASRTGPSRSRKASGRRSMAPGSAAVDLNATPQLRVPWIVDSFDHGRGSHAMHHSGGTSNSGSEQALADGGTLPPSITGAWRFGDAIETSSKSAAIKSWRSAQAVIAAVSVGICKCEAASWNRTIRRLDGRNRPQRGHDQCGVSSSFRAPRKARHCQPEQL
ncbi:hypothetical protein FQR65_LT20039 [Abscondita terminalis]|nr:hypothetical protein FQR65_LT20039 [Abscondita terminalis]